MKIVTLERMGFGNLKRIEERRGVKSEWLILTGRVAMDLMGEQGLVRDEESRMFLRGYDWRGGSGGGKTDGVAIRGFALPECLHSFVFVLRLLC